METKKITSYLVQNPTDFSRGRMSEVNKGKER